MPSPGVYAAVLTPLQKDLTIDHKTLFSHATDLLKRGCEGIALFGTTGEGPAFSVSQRQEALQKLISRGFAPQKLILGNGSAGISDTVSLARASLQCGCSTLLISPPSYYKNISEEGVVAYYRSIVEQTARPELRVLLYHFPYLTGVPITETIIDRLRTEYPQTIIGIKESEGNLAFTRAVLARFPGFQVFVGNESQIPEAVRHGGAGSICGIANLYPELIHALYKKPTDADRVRIEALFKALEGVPFIPAAKALMEQWKGASWQFVCPPLVPLPLEQRREFFTRIGVRP